MPVRLQRGAARHRCSTREFSHPANYVQSSPLTMSSHLTIWQVPNVVVGSAGVGAQSRNDRQICVRTSIVILCVQRCSRGRSRGRVDRAS